jgi:iduronate 2-sulfatase
MIKKITSLPLFFFFVNAIAQQQPNVLFIIVDDLRPQLGCYGESQMHTPNMDKLAKQGILFRRAYCQQAVCNPSRTSLLTGMRPATTKISNNDDHFRCHINSTVTLPQYFKQNGYHTQSVGKVFHTNLDDPYSWSVKSWIPPNARYGKPETIAWIEKEKQRLKAEGKEFFETVEYGHDSVPLHVQQTGIDVKGPSWEDPEVHDTALRDGKTMLQAIKILRELKAVSKPFFLAVGISNPHLPFAAPKKYYDLYPPEGIRLAQNNRPPSDVPDYAVMNGGDLYRYNDIEGKYKVSAAKARELVRGYYAATSYADALIGNIIDELEQLGLKQNTIIVLIGDHGWHLGENSVWAKQTNFEMGTRSPFIIVPAGNYLHAGAKPDGIVELVDVYPTLTDMAGLKVPANLEGSSLKPFIQKPQGVWKQAAFSQYPRKLNGKSVMGCTIRTERYRYTEWVNRETQQLEAAELYDHSTDPEENSNLAAKSSFAALRKQLSNQLKAGWKKAVPVVVKK